MMTQSDIQSFSNEMLKWGLNCPLPIVNDGQINRCHVEGDKQGSKNGWYVFFNNSSFSVGVFGNWKTGDEKKWSSKEMNSLTAEEHREYQSRMAEAKRRYKEAKEKERVEAKLKAQKTWKESVPALPDHPYLLKKQIKPNEIKQSNDQLIIPLYDRDEIQSLQFIYPDGTKQFLKGGKKKGFYYSIGSITEKIYIAEGFATASTIYETTNCMTIVAFDAGNLLSISKKIKEQYPNKEIILCADNDKWTESNPGITKATEAAKTISAKLAIPEFKDVRSKPTDFNDLMILEGIEQVERQINTASFVKETAQETVERLSKIPFIEYEQKRVTEAKKLNVRVSILDQAVDKLRKKPNQIITSNELENNIEAWNEPVDGNLLALEIKTIFDEHIVMPTDLESTVLTLWVLGSYCFDAFSIFPKLLVSSPIKACGKSTLLEILSCLSHKALITSNISSAALFRAINQWRPTVIIDEGDSFLQNNEEIRGIINSGHKKTTAYVMRVEGNDNKEVKRFSTWCPMIIGMIGKPSDTIVHRSIIISMKRKKTSEKVKKLSLNADEKYFHIRRKSKRWAEDAFDSLKYSAPDVSNISNINDDRTVDNYFPLFAIADRLGGHWRSCLDNFLKDLVIHVNDEENTSTLLLDDIKTIFDRLKTEKIHSDTLLKKLTSLEERPWNELNNGRGLTKNGLAKKLKQFGIQSKQTRIGVENKNGYHLADFQDIFERYLSASPFQNSTTLQDSHINTFRNFQNSTNENRVEFQNDSEPNSNKDCRVVEFQNGVDSDIHNETEIFVI